MKKIILLLFIGSGLYAQVPIPKSTTTFSNISATGTLKVASTSTLVGKVRIGANTAPSATLDVTGTMSVSGTSTLNALSTTSGTLGNVLISGNGVNGGSGSLSLQSSGSTKLVINSGGAVLTGTLGIGSTAYTGGTTSGTVAVLSDAVFPLTFSGNIGTVNDANNYYWGNNPYLFSSTASNGTVTIPYNAVLVGWDFSYVNAGTLATAENATLSIQGTTSYTCSTSITFTATNAQSRGTSLSQNFNAGDRINASLLMPTFATNPSSLNVGITLWFVRRQ